jgi:hypothetical protein
MGGWVGPRACLNIFEKRKISCLLEIEPHTIQPVSKSLYWLQHLSYQLQIFSITDYELTHTSPTSFCLDDVWSHTEVKEGKKSPTTELNKCGRKFKDLSFPSYKPNKCYVNKTVARVQIKQPIKPTQQFLTATVSSGQRTTVPNRTKYGD